MFGFKTRGFGLLRCGFCGAFSALSGFLLLERRQLTAHTLRHFLEALERARRDAKLRSADADALKVEILAAFAGNVGVAAGLAEVGALPGELVNS